MTFLEKVKEALAKYTPLDPTSLERQLILKDKFIIRSISDIRKKLQKLAVGPGASLNNLCQVVSQVFYN